jgi:hypothetical protein
MATKAERLCLGTDGHYLGRTFISLEFSAPQFFSEHQDKLRLYFIKSLLERSVSVLPLVIRRTLSRDGPNIMLYVISERCCAPEVLTLFGILPPAIEYGSSLIDARRTLVVEHVTYNQFRQVVYQRSICATIAIVSRFAENQDRKTEGHVDTIPDSAVRANNHGTGVLRFDHRIKSAFSIAS